MRLHEPPNPYVEDPVLRGVLDDLLHWLRQFLRNDMIDGRVVEVEFDGPGRKTARHNLGRVPLGWHQRSVRVKPGDDPIVCSDLTWDRETITFVASGAGTLTAWVF